MKVLPLPFPSKGLHQSSSVSEQPEGTSPLALNVRGYDLIARRDRGCQRSGMTRLANALNTDEPIDCIKTAMLGQTSPTVGGFSYTYSAATMDALGNGNHTVGHATIIGYSYSAAYQKFRVASSKTAMPSSGNAIFTPGFSGMKADTVVYGATVNYQGGAGLVAATFSPGNGTYYIRVEFKNASVILSMRSVHGTTTQTFTTTAWTNGSRAIEIDIGPLSVICKLDAATLLTHVYSSAEQQIVNDLFNVSVSAVMYGTALLEISLATATPGSDLYDSIAITATAGGNADPLSEHVCYLQKASDGTGVITVGSVISGFTQLTNGARTDGYYSTLSQIDMVAGYGAFWLVDGVQPLRKVVPYMAAASYPAATAGSLPTLARVLALYRGRLFHGGALASPYNYFASRSGDPLDYDYSQLDQAGAFAGNATLQAGLLADYLTAFIPFGDVSMLIGMGSSLAIMRGDPKAGGDIALLSREIGVASLNAWCRTPDGAVFFMARDGLYRINGGNLGSAPQPVSRGRLDDTLGHIDWTQFSVAMAWDPLELGIKIVLVPFDATLDTTVVFWEQRKDAFWVDTIPATIGPRAVASLRGSGGPGGLMLMGGYDGWIRHMNPAAYSDDGLPITSRVRYGFVSPFGQNVAAKMTGFRQLLGNEADVPFNLVYGFFVGTDPITASAQTSYDQTGTLTAGGYQSLSNQRSRGNTLILELSNDELEKTWQVEQTTLLLSPSGRVRA